MFGVNRAKIIAVVAVLSIAIVISAVVFASGGTSKSPISRLPAGTAAIDVSSNRYSRVESGNKEPYKLSLEGFTKIMEDDKLEVWHKVKNASIRIVDKTSGYVWGGLAEDKPSDMNTTWSGIGNAIASIDYFDIKGVEKRLSIADSSVNKSFTQSGNKVKYSVNYKEVGIAFDFEMELKNGELSFKMLDNSIKETKKYSLASVYFVPFLGSTKGDEINGYIFVPDGPGALIRFNKPTQYLVNFDKRVYGKDYAIDSLNEVNDLKASRPNDFTTKEPTISMPVFGMVQGVKQNAVFARITKGAEYASIMATPSGVQTNYNWATSKFIYRQKYLQPTSRNGSGLRMAQKMRNTYEAEITYRFLSGNDADYVGMAKLYRNLLNAEKVLNGKEDINKVIPLQLDVIGSDIEKGFLYNSAKVLTSQEQIKSIVDKLNSSGINNITMVLQGWQKGGVGGSKPSDFEFEHKLGDKKGLLGLSNYVNSKGGKFYFYENPVTVNKLQIDLKKQCGNALSQMLISVARDNDTIWFKDLYYTKSNLVADYITKKANQYKDNGMKGMAIGSFGSDLYAENLVNRVTTRLDARKKFEKAAETVSNNERLALYNPNEYLWKYSKEIFDTPMVNSQYLFETDSVPFMQIVLKGSIDYYAPYSNMSFYSKMDALKMIEYGTNPSFLLTGVGNSEMGYTTSSEYYSTRYDDWQDNIIEVYKFVNTPLSKVKGKIITDRTVLSLGVVKVDYEGDVSIIVNYTENAFKFGNMDVPAQSYAIVGGV